MDSGKAEKFEKHRKEMQRKAFLNITIILLLVTGLGLYIAGYAADFLFMVFSTNIAVLFSAMFVGVIVVIWSIPMLHYREEMKMISDKDKSYYQERDLADSPVIQVLEQQGWEEVKSDDKEVVLETHPSFFHKIIKRKVTLILEKKESTEEKEISVLRTRRKGISKIKTEYEEKDGETEITETTVSLSRVSPVYLEITMYLMPEIEGMVEDIGEEGLEVLEENVEFGLSRYSLEK
ncbi:MAG: hypothetical protein ABEK04_01135 [Candidatus Nanohalobium sp.]